jgi:hypothetical protein
VLLRGPAVRVARMIEARRKQEQQTPPPLKKAS